MKYIIIITVTFLIGIVSTAPTENSQTTSKSKNKLLSEKYVLYRGEHDITNILLTANSLYSKDPDERSSGRPPIYFSLADFVNGQKEDKGFYVHKNGEVMKLLDHGRDAATSMDAKNEVYIAAEDGIYKYNPKNNAAEKYGIVTDNLIGIAKVNGSDIIYVLAKDYVVYKVSEKGMKVDKVVEIINPEQIVLDYENNLFYVANNNVNVFNANGIRKIEGLPETIDHIKLLRPPLFLDTGILVIVDNTTYLVFANGTSTLTKFDAPLRSTAYSLEGTILIYIGYDKKIYEYNIIAMMFDTMFSKLKEYLES